MSRFARFGAGDALIGLSVLSLVFAALLPTYRASRFEGLVEEAIGQVDALRAGVERSRQMNGSWPPAAGPGEIPAGLTGTFQEAVLGGPEYVLEWRLFDRVEFVLRPVVVPPTPILDPDEEPDPEALEFADVPPDSASLEPMPVVRDMGAIVVHARDDRLLAALLAHHGSSTSFVRDTTWTLIIPPAS